MAHNLKEVLETARRLINALPCEFAEVRLSESEGTTIMLSGDRIDSISSGDSIGGSVRILKDGAWGFVSFNSLGDIEAFIRKGMQISSFIHPGVKSGVTPYHTVNKAFSTVTLKDFRNISIDEKFSLISRYNNILKSSEHIQNTQAMYRDFHSSYVYLNNEGSEISYDKCSCGISLTAYAKDGSRIQPYHDSISGFGGFEIVEGREGTAESVSKIAVDLLSAEPAPGGKQNIIANQKLAGVFIHEAFGHLSEADFVHENENLRNVMVFGKHFGPDNLNVADDGNMNGLSGYIPFDDEGVIPEKTMLISKGVLTGRLHSRETAHKMNEPLTGNGRSISVMMQPIVRMTNTFIENGDSTPDEIFETAGNCIYAIDYIGGQTNLEMFTFTSGYGYEIKNGKKGKMYKDIVLSGNVFHTLKNIIKIGNDRKMYGGLGGCGKGGQSPLPVSFGGPHLLIQDVLIGGAL